MSIKAPRFINTFLMIGINNLINPIANPINEKINKTVAKIVSVVILLNFNINNCLFVFDETNVCNVYNTMQIFNKF